MDGIPLKKISPPKALLLKLHFLLLVLVAIVLRAHMVFLLHFFNIFGTPLGKIFKCSLMSSMPMELCLGSSMLL